MATGTYAPWPHWTGFDNDDNPLNGGFLYTYVAGLVDTPATTYTDVGLSVENENPIELDSAGRATIFLAPGASYKFVLKDANLVTIWTRDHISAVPASSANLDITGTAGEALTAGDAVYLSDGSGSLVAGSWYRTSASNSYSSTTPVVGFAVADIASGASGAIRTAGVMTGLTGLTVGTTYYLAAAAGALAGTSPALSRVVGVAATTTSLVLATTLAQVGTLIVNGAATFPGGITGPVVVTGALTATGLLTAPGIPVLLHAASGTSTSATAANVDTVAITGLTALDTLEVEVTLLSETAATAVPVLYSTTDAVIIVTLTNAAFAIPADSYSAMTATIRQVQSGPTHLFAKAIGFDPNTGLVGATNTWNNATVVTAWTGSWTLALRHGGVTAGGTLRYSWVVRVLKGQ